MTETHATLDEGQDAPDGGAELYALVLSPARADRELMGRACQRAGFQPIECVSAEDALALVDELGVSLCCVSSAIGASVLTALVRDLRAALPGDAPILLLSDAAEVNEHEALFGLGVTEVFHPSHPERLVQYLKTRDAERRGPRGQHVYGKRVLLVEDSRTVAHVVQRMLTAHGLQVDWVQSGEEALERIPMQRYDLMITDLVLEGVMSGLALVGHVRREGYDDFTLPILAMTGFDDPVRRRELFRLGVNDYVIKPVMEEELLVRARNLIIANRLAVRVEAQRARINLLEVTDPLTGLHNRRMLFSMGSKYVAMARSTGGSFSLVLLDVDRLGEINHDYGHAAGDEVLRLTAAVLSEGARESDLAARIGDIRFALALPHCSPADALRVGERLRQSIAGMLPFGVPLAASLGVVSFDPALDEDFDAMASRTLQSIERSRSEGRDRVIMAEHAPPTGQPVPSNPDQTLDGI
ncbi:MAG: diguanylate cyclase [Halothiobacillaceae bacterium]|nr:MAG: diguanylate cyclase [Halothiobacillaceae bacterium]